MADDQNLKIASDWWSPVLVVAPTREERAAYARRLHQHSASSSGPFVAIRCEGDRIIPSGDLAPPPSPELPEPDGVADWFERASGGTLFIDEIASLSQTMQAQLYWLLRGDPPRTAAATRRVRVIAGAHAPLESEVAAGRFRAALFYRLNVIRIDLPESADPRS